MVELENKKRFSQSLLWRYEHSYFNKKGINAWALGETPYYVTNNALIAHHYATIVLRFIQDCLHNHVIQPDLPLYVFELGAGSGKFGYLFLQKITELLRHFHLEQIKFCYVMTDFATSNLAYWREHPRFQKFIQEGTLDFSLFDASKEHEVRLVYKKTTIDAGSNHNPLIVLANYFFDSLTSDVVRIKTGTLEEGLVTLKTTSDNIASDDVLFLDRVSVDFSFRGVNLPYYGHNSLDEILADYKAKLNSGTVLVPVGGVTAIDNLRRLSNGKLLVIATDKGYTSLESMTDLGVPHIAFHGGFSTMVNFDFLGRYVNKLGGDALLSEDREGMKVSLFSFGQKFASLPEAALANYQYSILLSTKEFLEIKNFLIQDVAKLDLDHILSLMKFSYWDPDIFMSIVPRLVDCISQASASYLRALRSGLKIIDDNYYFIKNNKKIPYELGNVYQLIGDFETALKFYQQALDYFGEEFMVLFKMGLCYYHKGDLPLALQYFRQAQKLDAEHDATKEWIVCIEKKLR